MHKIIEHQLKELRLLNTQNTMSLHFHISKHNGKLQKVLVANRGEIAKRFFLTLQEEDIPSVAIVADVDIGQSWYSTADEVIYIGDYTNYTNIERLIAAVLLSQANGIYPGYGFLSENIQFVESIEQASKIYKHEIIFMGASATVMKKVGNKLDARRIAKEIGVPVFDGSEDIRSYQQAKDVAKQIGYPVLLKLNQGGGGKGMIIVNDEADLQESIETCKSIGISLYKDDTFYIEKFITRPAHIEVQIFNGIPVGIRKCAVQRNNQKIIEETGETCLSQDIITELNKTASQMARASGYDQNNGAGTVEFLLDTDMQQIGFLEMNTRLQVEHPVTDISLDIDLAKWQVLNFDGRLNEIPLNTIQTQPINHHAIECRIYAEDPSNNYAPSPGQITALDLPSFIGIRCDFGFYIKDHISSHYDPMIGKIIVYANDRQECLKRLKRALSELYIGGITTNIAQLYNIIQHKQFQDGSYNNQLIKQNPEINTTHIDNLPSMYIAIFAALCHRIKHIALSAEACLESNSLYDSMLMLDDIEFYETYDVSITGQTYKIRIIQNTIFDYHIYVYDTYITRFELRSLSPNAFIVRQGLLGYRIKLYHHQQKDSTLSLQVRFPNREVYHAKANVYPSNSSNKQDPPGKKRSPFQSTFVRLAREKPNSKKYVSIGSQVKKDQPIMVIAAMKMETTVYAPVDGKITYLLEEGNLSKLMMGTTDQGLVIGRSIKEDEALFIIDNPKTYKTENDVQDHVKNKQEVQKLYKRHFSSTKSNSLTHLTQANQVIQVNDIHDAHILVDITFAYLKGYFADTDITKRIFQSFSEDIVLTQYTEKDCLVLENKICSLINFYMKIKQIFSHAIAQNEFSYFDELNLYYQSSKKGDNYHFLKIKPILDEILDIYAEHNNATCDSLRSDEGNTLIFLLLQKAFYHCISSVFIIKILIQTLGKLPGIQYHTSTILNQLIKEEEKERDTEIADYARKIFPDLRKDFLFNMSEKYVKAYTKFIKQPFYDIESTTQQKIISSLSEQGSHKTVDTPLWFQTIWDKKVQFLDSKYDILPLHPIRPNILIFSVCNKNEPEDTRYLCIAVIELPSATSYYNIKKASYAIQPVEQACIDIAKTLHIYQGIQKRHNTYGEIYVSSNEIEVSLLHKQPKHLHYTDIVATMHNVLNYFFGIHCQDITVHLLKNSTPLKIPLLQVSCKEKNGKIFMEWVDQNYETYKWFPEKLSTQQVRLYKLGKWPIEKWITLTFDSKKYKEILFDMLDKTMWTNPKTNRQEIKPVGSKIFLGKVNRRYACFYMKDSRIAGGATGDLEGLKYVAACYLATLLGIPLYVWNDGAGANIKEGVVTLKRAAQGFMSNALIGARLPQEYIAKLLKQLPDKRLRSLLDMVQLEAELLKQLYPEIIPHKPFIIAVGTGSSTGLDVYGSSQAAIQVMLDADQSYRVLTGANVIEAVTGEKMTNYEIGGARVMGEWTGTVNLIANHKFQLLEFIYQIQETLIPQKQQEIPVRKNNLNTDELHAFEVINEKILMNNVDDNKCIPLSQKYYKSGSLLAVFAQLAGYPILVMGARTDFGIHSFAAMTKAQEMLSIAYKLGAHQILIFGKNMLHRNYTEDAGTLRASINLSKTLNEKQGIRIHILTHPDAFYELLTYASADIVIYINRNKQLHQSLKKVIHQTAAFVVDSYQDAFNLIAKLLAYLNDKEGTLVSKKDKTALNKPSLPKSENQPFDIISSVIEQIFDTNSFIELYKTMNDPDQGPSLITGLARINGKTVGILADQPNILSGAADALGTDKFRIFVEFLEFTKVPLIMLSNSPGFLPGAKQERLRIQQIGGESLNVNVLSTIPVVSIVLKQNYGGRLIHAFCKDLRPGIISIALSKAIMSVMGAEAAFNLFHKKNYVSLLQEDKKQEADNMRQNYIQKYNEQAYAMNNALKADMIDFIVEDPAHLRTILINALDASEKQVKALFQ